MRIWMFCGKFAEEGDNPVNNPNIYNIEGDNKKCVQNVFFFSVWFLQLYFLKPEMILLSSAKQNIQVLYILE